MAREFLSPIKTGNIVIKDVSGEPTGVKEDGTVFDLDAGRRTADVSPLTTKGDIWAYDTANVRLRIGDNYQVLHCDSVQKEGIAWTSTPRFGDVIGGDYTEFEADGTVKFNGAATVWDDLRVSVNSVRVPASNQPSWGAFKTGLQLLWFGPTSDEEVYFAVQMPHSWAGTDITPHVHWVSADTAGGAGTDVCWGLEYSWANIDQVFPATVTVYADEQTNGSGETITVDKHYMTLFTAITPSPDTPPQDGISTMLVCRLFRDANGTGGTDDYDDDAGLLEFDIHYEIDTIGSRAIGTK